MARRGWSRSIFFAALAAAGTAAAQLGLGYGLGVIAWVPAEGSGPTAAGAFTASLAWASWLTATSVVAGAAVGNAMAGSVGRGLVVRITWRISIALAATLGALVAIPLVAVPASRAEVIDNYAPHLLAGVHAGAGAVVGLLVALVALAARSVAANVFVSACWLWLLAVIALVDGPVADGAGYGQLAAWKFTDAGPKWHSFYIPGALLMLGAALLIGGLAAFPAAGRGDRRLGVMLSGAAGPLLVAVAYVLAAPGVSESTTEEYSAYVTAPYMVLAGVLGSLLVALVGTAPSRPRRKQAVQRPAAGAATVPVTNVSPGSVSPGSGATGSGATGFAPAQAIPTQLPSRPLPPPSSAAISAKASVPAASRINPNQR